MPDPKAMPKNAVLSENADDALIPGVVIVVDPDEAKRLGAFEEDALDHDTAWNANLDIGA